MSTNNTKVAIFGDWHGDTAWAQAMLRHIAEAGITRYIHVGDHGIHWPTPEYAPWADGPIPPAGQYTSTNIELTEQLGLQGIIVDGNHDNHTALRALPVDQEGFGVIAPNLRYARRGSRLTIGRRTFGFLGGAFSIDYMSREEGTSVWIDQEQTTLADVEQLGTGQLDVLVTHDVPTGVNPQRMFQLPQLLELRSAETRDLLRIAVDRTRPALVFSGHWHQRGTHRLPGGTQVHILDRERKEGNAVILDIETLHVEPLDMSVLKRQRG